MSSKTKLDIWSWRAQVSFHSSSDHSVMEYIVSPREFPLYIIYTSDIVVMTYAVIGSPKHPSVVFIPIIVMKIGNIVITEHKNMPEPSMLSYVWNMTKKNTKTRWVNKKLLSFSAVQILFILIKYIYDFYLKDATWILW